MFCGLIILRFEFYALRKRKTNQIQPNALKTTTTAIVSSISVPVGSKDAAVVWFTSEAVVVVVAVVAVGAAVVVAVVVAIAIAVIAVAIDVPIAVIAFTGMIKDRQRNQNSNL